VNVEQPRVRQSKISNAEFIAVTALITAMGALSIDTILPAFPEIRAHLGLAPGSTKVSLLVTAYLLGMGLGQIPAGIISDRFGRKKALTFFVGIYMIGVVGMMVAPSLPLAVLARVVWGLGGSGPRVVAIAMVRDSHEGVRMAQVLSYVQSIFVLVPVLAPSLGALALHVGGWRATVAVPAAVAVVLIVWMLRIPETLSQERRRPASLQAVRHAFATILRHRPTVLYAVSMAFLFGCISSYISLAETIIDDLYGRKSQFPIIFGVIAASMGVSTLINARLVGRLGLKRMLTTIPVITASVAVVLALICIQRDGKPPFLVFAIGMALLLSAQTLITPNVNARSLGPHGALAGLAAGITGMISTIGGAILGTIVSQLHDGSTRTITIAIAVFLLTTTAIVRLAQRLEKPERF
jgi:MFS transporter, DHA1 family, multidrug resistance protein